jgi:hypothetical protein
LPHAIVSAAHAEDRKLVIFNRVILRDRVRRLTPAARRSMFMKWEERGLRTVELPAPELLSEPEPRERPERPERREPWVPLGRPAWIPGELEVVERDRHPVQWLRRQRCETSNRWFDSRY